VASGSTGAGTTPETESFALSGLQPGVRYAYRIAIHSGYGSAQGTQGTFTTAGMPVTLTAPATSPLLAIPAIVFPAQTTTGSPTTTKRSTHAPKLGRTLKGCRKKAKHKRSACERQVRKRTGKDGAGKKAAR
jgi:hypothetical protein